ncbi:hypothetical protein HPS36_01425 [Halorubrum salinarum]|uniref:Uncharacterized protein n=1 Tax=Halorubrum salinarum TaxID=2739057 RepID=A0A7D3XSN8_9EURY|nr:hypothetical protein [Halorubrum salinarum]QKG91569.1 hypothetical protein HPS36_01425 [Halorubrum salinarum]
MYAIQVGFWAIVFAAGALAVGYQRAVSLAAAVFGAAILLGSVALELTER